MAKQKKTAEQKLLTVDCLSTLMNRLEKNGEKILEFTGSELITSVKRKKYRYGLFDGIARKTEIK